MPPAAASTGVQSGRPANAPPLVVARRALQGTTRNAKGAVSLTCPLTCPFFSPVPLCPRPFLCPPRRHGGGKRRQLPIYQPNGDPMGVSSLGAKLACRQPMEEPRGRSHRAHNGLQ